MQYQTKKYIFAFFAFFACPAKSSKMVNVSLFSCNLPMQFLLSYLFLHLICLGDAKKRNLCFCPSREKNISFVFLHQCIVRCGCVRGLRKKVKLTVLALRVRKNDKFVFCAYCAWGNKGKFIFFACCGVLRSLDLPGNPQGLHRDLARHPTRRPRAPRRRPGTPLHTPTARREFPSPTLERAQRA